MPQNQTHHLIVYKEVISGWLECYLQSIRL